MDYIKHFKSLECYLVSADVPFTIRPPSAATRSLKLNWIVKSVQTREHVQMQLCTGCIVCTFMQV